ncbi:ABC-type transport auxiliary lipoprotein family protein [Bradyrhizobium sp. 2TAF24]|uniref:ABC-type transport auxiliary lipoprotein family protein n=1 Tax=Bradyrhizobium sp. 2TAF24 TaxID=3233011 RepID=UPI003F92D424
METRAPFAVVGAFVLAAIVAVFGFVYWMHSAGGIGTRTTYQVQFHGPVPGLLVGAAVLFNGIRVGEVTGLSLAADDPQRVDAVIAVGAGTPVRSDTRVGLEFQGLTGVPVVALQGGKERGAASAVTTLVADADVGQSMTEAARNALKRVDTVLADNAEPLQSTIANLKTFTDGLARNTERIDGILTGLQRMVGGGAPATPKLTYDLAVPTTFAPQRGGLKGRWTIPEPTGVLMLDTRRLLVEPSGEHPAFDDAQWADNIPKLLQEKLIESFENFDLGHAPLRASDEPPDHQLMIGLRRFQVTLEPAAAAEIAFSARLVARDGRVVASRLFQGSRPLARPDAAAAVAAFGEVFQELARILVEWMAQAPVPEGSGKG